MEDIKKKKTFSGDVISRMLSDLEFEAFWARYKDNRKGRGSRDRFAVERLPLNDNESKFLHEYFNSQDKTITQLAEQYNYPVKGTISTVYRLLLRVSWLNKEKFDF